MLALTCWIRLNELIRCKNLFAGGEEMLLTCILKSPAIIRWPGDTLISSSRDVNSDKKSVIVHLFLPDIGGR